MINDWEVFAIFDDKASAEATAGRLRLEGVPSLVRAEVEVPGLSVFRQMVPKELAHRARWAMSLAETSDSELTFLATGRLGNEDETPHR
jgi:hypothetical protein